MKYSSLHIRHKIQDYRQLVKFSLSFTVTFSAVISYLLAPKVVEFNWGMISWLFLGGLLVTGSANALNEVLEKDTDAKMNRTASRPVAAGRMSVTEARIAIGVMLVAGLIILGLLFNLLSAVLSLVSWFIYITW